MVTGGITAIDLAVGAVNATVTERACSSLVAMTTGNICTGGLPNQLAALMNSSGVSPVNQSFGLTSRQYSSSRTSTLVPPVR